MVVLLYCNGVHDDDGPGEPKISMKLPHARLDLKCLSDLEAWDHRSVCSSGAHTLAQSVDLMSYVLPS